MKLPNDLQKIFLQEVKQKIDNDGYFVDRIADDLNISRDSAYRRIRCETTLDFREIQVLCNKYSVSLDRILNQGADHITFDLQNVDYRAHSFKNYFDSLLETITKVNQYEDKYIICGARDIPITHFWQSDELAKFKLFFWLKTSLNHPDFAEKNFDLDMDFDDLMETGKKIWLGYARLPVNEIWNRDTPNVVLYQIEYCVESGIVSRSLASHLCNSFKDLIQHTRHECEEARKFTMGTQPGPESGDYYVYVNEVSSTDNNIYFSMGDQRVVLLTYNTLHILTTSDPNICDQSEAYYKNILKRSMLIAGTAEKVRNKFFNYLINNIEETRRRLSI